MSSRSLRRSVVILAFAALLAPVTGLHAAQTRPAPAPHHHNVVIQFLLGLLAGTGIQSDAGVMTDNNG
ncbi:MAG TPA: hypothetical protein VOA80_01230 [Thermoanaerobaculia bacterium]|nr:hypothetical protein [Thermoanaerobaculia bacterium]